jgi:hypothetical protein
MPRPVDESKFRRFMMQGIMWVILGATVGAAALVNQTKQRALKVVLDPARKFDGFSIQLPRGWDNTDVSQDENEIVAVVDPAIGDELSVSSTGSRHINNFGRPIATVSIAGQTSKITLYTVPPSEDGPPLSRLGVTRDLDGGRVLVIALLSPNIARRGDLTPLDYEIEIMKKVAASVQLDEPATSPEP